MEEVRLRGQAHQIQVQAPVVREAEASALVPAWVPANRWALARVAPSAVALLARAPVQGAISSNERNTCGERSSFDSPMGGVAGWVMAQGMRIV